jgi:hypothetical protein
VPLPPPSQPLPWGALPLLLLSPPAGPAAPAGSSSVAAPAPAKPRPQFGLASFQLACRQPGVAGLLLVKTTAGLGFALFHSAFPRVVSSRFGLDSRGNGLLMSYVGVLAIAGA